MNESVYTVHATKRDDVGAVEVMYARESDARAFAATRSRDVGVVAASVTRYLVDQLGARYPVAWFVDGVEQPHRSARVGTFYPTDAG